MGGRSVKKVWECRVGSAWECFGLIGDGSRYSKLIQGR